MICELKLEWVQQKYTNVYSKFILQFKKHSKEIWIIISKEYSLMKYMYFRL